jgi:opacity protein-like surface antigen
LQKDYSWGAHTNAYGTILKAKGDLVNGSGSNNGFAMEWGGGLDWAVGKNIQIRPVEVDYLYTHLGSNHVVGYSASQNNFKYVTGVNFTFGSK